MTPNLLRDWVTACFASWNKIYPKVEKFGTDYESFYGDYRDFFALFLKLFALGIFLLGFTVSSYQRPLCWQRPEEN